MRFMQASMQSFFGLVQVPEALFDVLLNHEDLAKIIVLFWGLVMVMSHYVLFYL